MGALTVLGFLGVQIFDITIFKRQHPKTDMLKELEPQTSAQIEEEKELQPQILPQANVEKEPNQETPSQQIGVGQLPLSKLMEILKDFPSTNSKFEFIKHNIEFIPDSLTLSDLNHLLKQFPRSNEKLKIIKIFLSRLETDYPDDEFKKFKSQFSRSSDKIQAINLLLRNKK